MKPFLHGKKPITAPPLNTLRAKALPAIGGAVSVPAANPATNVEVVKEGDKVVRIIVTCACGERTEIECLYPAGS